MKIKVKKEHKSKIKVIFLIVLLLIITGGLFYWHSLRPAQIKHDCSWVTKTKPAIPYRAAMTLQQMKDDGMIEDCREYATPSGIDSMSQIFAENRRSNIINPTCESDKKKRIAHYTKEQQAVPAKDYQERASKEEYSFCLHDKGL